MKIYIDQSGKIENTNTNTVVAFSNGIEKSILSLAKDKKTLQQTFRELGRGRIFIYKIFASLIYSLIKDYLHDIKQIVIDQEYKGHEAKIKHFLLQIIRKAKKDFPKDNVTFEQMGKKSKAHILAHKIYQKRAEADILANVNKIFVYLFRLK